ncbi:MAG: M12 family metallopeptidase [Pirellulaceae bacterium]|nr:M12 family metallopeptidase [Pirellulaceae bacterium]
MAKKKTNTSSTSSNSSSARAHICFERILPDLIDGERMVRRALRRAMADSDGGSLNADDVAHRSRMAIPLSKKWETGQILRCRFLHGSATVQKKVEAIAHQWEKHANVKFKFVKTGDAEIRIAFADDGSWSAVGRDALKTEYFPKHQPTMNYGWLDSLTSTVEYQRVVLHEFGHALGCIHEHQQPKFDRKWNQAKVLEYFSGSPNFWDEAEIKSNVLQKYSPTGIAATDFDADSIMLYMFEAELFSDGKGPTNDNKKLSTKDIEFIKKLYPKL